MGYMTTVTILNDSWDVIRDNPEEFVEGIHQNMHRGGSFGVKNHCNPAEVMRTHHADDFHLYGTWQNSTVDLSDWYPRNERGDLFDRAEQSEHLREWLLAMVKRAKYDLEKFEKRLKEGDQKALIP